MTLVSGAVQADPVTSIQQSSGLGNNNAAGVRPGLPSQAAPGSNRGGAGVAVVGSQAQQPNGRVPGNRPQVAQRQAIPLAVHSP